MKTGILYFVAALISLACQKNPGSVDVMPSSEETGTEIKEGASYLALGDSYTIGQSVTIAERWPVILAKDLRKLNVKVADPDIIATTGWTTRDLLNALANSKPAKTYDIVSLLIGVNNQYQGQSIVTYRTEFKTLLSKSIELAAGKREKVFVLSIPDWGASKYGASYDRTEISKEIDQFNAVAKEECLKEKVLFLNITDISRRALNNSAMIASDGLHFSGEMHQLWVDAVLPQVKAIL